MGQRDGYRRLIRGFFGGMSKKYYKVTFRVEDQDGEGYEFTAWRVTAPKNHTLVEDDLLTSWDGEYIRSIPRCMDFSTSFTIYPDPTKQGHLDMYQIARLPRPEGETDVS